MKTICLSWEYPELLGNCNKQINSLNPKGQRTVRPSVQ